MTLRLIARSLVPVAVVVLATIVFGTPAVASDATSMGVAVSVNGGGFGSSGGGPLLDVDHLGPGDSATATLGIRSSMAGTSTLHLALRDVTDDDNGCVPAEQRVDTTCGSGQGDLGRTLRFTVSTAVDRDGPYRAVWTGPANDLLHDLDTGAQLTSGGEQWVRLAAALPASAGAEVESDTFGFGLTVSLVGANGALAVDAIDAHRGTGAAHVARHGTDAASTSSLASTGFAVLLYATAGFLLIAAGAGALLGARRRRRETAS